MSNAPKLQWSSRALRFVTLAAVVGLGMAACERAEETPATSNDTTAPTEDVQAPADEQPAETGSPVEEAVSDAPWTLPEGWTIVPGERPMRLATFEIADESGSIEVAVTQFPGRVGGELANVNRWRSQMGLPAVAESDLEQLLDRFEAPGYDAYIARVAGENSHMLVVAVYEAAEDRTWFTRASAPADAIDRVQPEMIAFARSIAGLGAEEGG